MEIIESDYCVSGPSIRDPRARQVTIKVWALNNLCSVNILVLVYCRNSANLDLDDGLGTVMVDYILAA